MLQEDIDKEQLASMFLSIVWHLINLLIYADIL